MTSITILRSTKSPAEHYEIIDEALTNVLRAAGAIASEQLLDHLFVYDRCLRIALGLPVKVNA